MSSIASCVREIDPLSLALSLGVRERCHGTRADPSPFTDVLQNGKLRIKELLEGHHGDQMRWFW